MPTRISRIPSFATARHQRGAVLYVAMIVLILLALIGIVGMQVSGLQEKMSANYRNVNLAFQNAEQSARVAECAVEAMVNRTAPGDCGVVNVDKFCDSGFDAKNWSSARALDDPAADTTIVREIGECIAGNDGSAAMGVKPKNENNNQVFQITVYSTDFVANPSADAAIDTTFRP